MEALSKEVVIAKLREVMDPHTGSNVYDMGLIEDLTIEPGRIACRFVLTSNFCPIGMQLGIALKRKLRELPVENVDVKIDNYLRSSELEQLLSTM